MLHRLTNEDISVATHRHAKWWPGIDSHNVVDLDGPALAPAPAVKP
jgi:hypothetical protein